jgi:hydrogenase maturation protease
MRLLIAGIGNIFRGDDAFGCELSRVLAERSWPEGVRVCDFGIRGFDLACALVEGYDGAIILDAVARGRPPGTLYLIEPEPVEGFPALDLHSLTPDHAFRLAASLGELPPWLRVIGCEPESLGDVLDGAMGLSTVVLAAVEGAIGMVEEVANDFLGSSPPKPATETITTPTGNAS